MQTQPTPKPPCPSCDGRRVVKCWNCKGRSWQDGFVCSECDDTGEEECGLCCGPGADSMDDDEETLQQTARMILDGCRLAPGSAAICGGMTATRGADGGLTLALTTAADLAKGGSGG